MEKMQRLLVQAKEMEAALGAAHAELAELAVTGQSACGLVRVRVTAAGAVKSVRIKDQALEGADAAKALEKAVKAAVADALAQARAAAAQRTAQAVLPA